MLFNPSKILLLSILITSAYAAPVPSSATASVQAIRDNAANGVLTAGDIVEAVAQGLGIDTKAGGIVQAVADGLKVGGSATGGKKGA
ncbi:hypothetical protein BKA61DRAFT_710458 [Leptodontidium sp. MPI-SDFR-AT-0119]|nr:hypothetical protein BKA61DRAFT_710458 [Leptodontidium sp. MPI-SDFR-AT-0119]